MLPPMPRTMLDSTTATDIPAGSPLVMGYVDGGPGIEWSAADWLRFPGRIAVRCAIYNDRFDANVLDVEAGNNGADGSLVWVRGKWARNETPTVYCSGDGGPKGYRLSDVRAACDAAGVKRPLILLAQWDNNPATFDPAGDPEIIGKQYADSAMTGGHWDASVVADAWPGVDPVGGSGMDAATYAAQLEPLVKGTIRVMLENDPACIAAIEKAAGDDTSVRTIGTKVGEVILQGFATK